MADDMVLVPRDLLTSALSELRSWSGHWAAGSPRVGELARHDTRMSDGSCCTCTLLELLGECAQGPAFDLGNPYGWSPEQIAENERLNADLGALAEDD